MFCLLFCSWQDFSHPVNQKCPLQDGQILKVLPPFWISLIQMKTKHSSQAESSFDGRSKKVQAYFLSFLIFRTVLEKNTEENLKFSSNLKILKKL